MNVAPLFQIFTRNSTDTTPWKNGGGRTREICKSDEDEPYWRLSIADVEEPGPFSPFVGLSRILTVIEGEGMILQSKTESISANLLKPVAFSGDEEIFGKLPRGAIQNFNLIYDATGWDADVTCGPAMELFSLPQVTPDIAALYCVDGSIELSDGTKLGPHSGLIVRGRELNIVSTGNDNSLLVSLRAKPTV